MAENHDFLYAENQCYPGSLVTRKSIHSYSTKTVLKHGGGTTPQQPCCTGFQMPGGSTERLSPSGYPWVVITNACSYFFPWPPKSCCHLPAPPRSFMLGWDSTADVSSLRSYHLTHRPGSHTTRVMASLLRVPIDLQIHSLL